MTPFRTSLMATAILAVCAASPAAAVDSPAPSKSAPDLAAVRAKIKAKDWPAAATDLRKLAQAYQHPDVYNLLGYTLRNMGNYAEAKSFYGKALDFDPQHKGALEYL